MPPSASDTESLRYHILLTHFLSYADKIAYISFHYLLNLILAFIRKANILYFYLKIYEILTDSNSTVLRFIENNKYLEPFV